jgi:hypothetical protein
MKRGKELRRELAREKFSMTKGRTGGQRECIRREKRWQ